MVTTFYPPYNFGGDGIYIYRLSNELARRGHQVDVIHCVDAYHILQPRAPTFDYPNHPGVTVHSLRSGVGWLSPLATHQTGSPLFKAGKIKAVLGERAFDVIHFHNISLIGGPKVLRLGDAVKLYTMHEHWLLCPLHVLWKYDREVCTTKNCVPCMIMARRPPQLWRYTGMLEREVRHVDAFISPSRFTRDIHHRMGLEIPMVHIPYFLPMTGVWSGEALPRAAHADRPYFLFVGRLEKIKGVQTLLRVFRSYDKADLLIAGDGSDESALRRMAEGLSHVRFLGRLSFPQLGALYERALAVIVPSLCYEVFGIIIIEAFSVKTPAIVNDLGALPEVIEESQGGFVYRNDAELVEAMEILRTDPATRRELGEKGHAAYLKHWTEEPHLAQYFGLIAEIAARKGVELPISTKVPNA